MKVSESVMAQKYKIPEMETLGVQIPQSVNVDTQHLKTKVL